MTNADNNPESEAQSNEEDENDDCDFTWSALEEAESAESGDSGDDEDLPDATRNTISLVHICPRYACNVPTEYFCRRVRHCKILFRR